MVLNYTFNMSGLDSLESCRLNQAAMLESTTKIPSTGYYILLIGFFALFFYFVIQPRLNKVFQEGLLNNVGLLGMSLVFLSLWVLFLGVFQLGEEELILLVRVAGWLIPFLLLLVGVFVYKWLRRWIG